MGNQIGSKNQVSVYVQQNIYQAGDNVSGIVYLNIQEEIDAEHLIIYLKCYEEFSLKVKNSSSSPSYSLNQNEENDFQVDVQQAPQTSYDYFKNTNVFYSHRIVLKKWNQYEILQVGNYEFPFEYKLFQNCQSSFWADIDHYAQLQYKVHAELKQYKDQGPVIKGNQRFLVKQDYSDLPQNFDSTQSTMIHKWLFVSQGVSKLRCKIDKTVYKPYDTIKIDCEIDNSKCEEKLRYLEVTLRHELRLQNQFKHDQVIKNIVFTQNYWGVKPQQTVSFPLISNRTIYPSTYGNKIIIIILD